MKSVLSVRNAVRLAVFAGVLSTSYAHAGQLYSCAYEDREEDTRFELKIREGENDGQLTYKYSPIGDPTVVEGQLEVKKISATWSHFIYTGRDSRGDFKLSVPAGLQDNGVYMQAEITVGDRLLEPRQFLECSRIR